MPLPPGSPREPPPKPCQRGVSSQPLGSCSSSSLSGLLCSNREQTPFMRPSRCFLPGLGPEEGDVTKMQTDDGSRHLGRGRAADLRQGAQPCVCEGVLAAGGPRAGTSLALWLRSSVAPYYLRGAPGPRTCCQPCRHPAGQGKGCVVGCPCSHTSSPAAGAT